MVVVLMLCDAHEVLAHDMLCSCYVMLMRSWLMICGPHGMPCSWFVVFMRPWLMVCGAHGMCSHGMRCSWYVVLIRSWLMVLVHGMWCL